MSAVLPSLSGYPWSQDPWTSTVCQWVEPQSGQCKDARDSSGSWFGAIRLLLLRPVTFVLNWLNFYFKH